VLRERLQKLHVVLPHSLQFSRKRPNLAANHRPRSSPQVIRSIGHFSIPSSPRNGAVIVHFTSLANFKLVKGVLQSVLGPNLGTTSRLPEVIIIPKPAGPRRVLTALHTAAVKPIVDPCFSPIETTPISSGSYPQLLTSTRTPSKSWSSQSRSYTSTPSRSFVSPPPRSNTTNSRLESPYTSSETPTYSNTLTPTSYSFTNTSTTTQGTSLRRPQTLPRSSLSSVRNVVAAWKSRSPSIDKSSQV
jgi:hypothetical protein